MAFFRLYTGSDGRSHLEVLGPHPPLEQERRTAHVRFRELERGTRVDWHNAPRPQYVFVLSGELEIGLTGGKAQRLVAGDVLHSMDTTGPGHTTRSVGSEAALIAIVPLDLDCSGAME